MKTVFLSHKKQITNNIKPLFKKQIITGTVRIKTIKLFSNKIITQYSLITDHQIIKIHSIIKKKSRVVIKVINTKLIITIHHIR